jgi:hypothetical protein
MRIGAGLLLIAAGAVLRFGISTGSAHGIAIHTIGDILMIVGILGVVLWLVVAAPWGRRRQPAYRDGRPANRDDMPANREEPVYREERSVHRADAPADEVPPERYPADPYQDEYRR